MTHYKLTYFDFRARGEIIRFVFAAAGVQYDDYRIEGSEWMQLKPKMPFYQLPILEFDGHVLCQSRTIARYLARKFNLAGKTELDQARADMLVDCMDDTTKPIIFPGYVMCKDAATKAAIEKTYNEEQLPGFLAAIEAMLKQNKNGDGFFVGDELTWADLAFVDMCGVLTVIGSDNQLVNYPKLQAARHRIEQVPNVAAWLAKRPQQTII